MNNTPVEIIYHDRFYRVSYLNTDLPGVELFTAHSTWKHVKFNTARYDAIVAAARSNR